MEISNDFVVGIPFRTSENTSKKDSSDFRNYIDSEFDFRFSKNWQFLEKIGNFSAIF